MNRYKVAAQIPVMGQSKQSLCIAPNARGPAPRMKKDLRDAVKYLDEQSEDFLRVMSE